MLSQQCPPTTITLLLTTKLTVPQYLQRVCQTLFCLIGPALRKELVYIFLSDFEYRPYLTI